MNTNKGFSLIEVIVAIGVMSLMSFFMMDMINTQNKALKSTQVLIDANEVQIRTQRLLLNSDICKESLFGYVFPLDTDVKIDSIKKSPTEILLSSVAPTNKFGGVEVESFMVKRLNDTELQFSILFKKTSASTSFGSENIIRSLSLSAELDPAVPNTIKNCSSQVGNTITAAVKAACEQICPTCSWNATTEKCIAPAAAASPATPGGSIPIYKRADGTLTLNGTAESTSYSCVSCPGTTSPCEPEDCPLGYSTDGNIQVGPPGPGSGCNNVYKNPKKYTRTCISQPTKIGNMSAP